MSNGTSLFFLTVNDNDGFVELWRVRIADRQMTQLARLGRQAFGTSDQIGAFEIDASNAYVPFNSQVLSVPLDGGAPTVLADVGIGVVSAVGVDDANVYFSESVAYDFLSEGVFAVAKSGGAALRLPGTTGLVAWDLKRLVVHGQSIYLPATSDASHPNDLIVAVDSITGAVTNVAIDAKTPRVLAIDQQVARLYWMDGADGQSANIMGCDLAQACDATIITTSASANFKAAAGFSSTLRADGGALVWDDGDGLHELHDGGSFAPAKSLINLFTLDADTVYWADYQAIHFAVRQ